jgi:hypothetical protein
MGIPHLPHSRTLVTLAAVALCALFLAWGTGNLLASGAAPRPVGVLKAKPAATAETGVRDVDKIVTRNVFCSACEPPEPTGEEEPRGPGEPLSGLPLRLIATLVSEEDPAWSFAAVQHAESGTTGLYSASPATPLPGGVLITDIEERQILVARDGRVGALKLEAEPPAQGAPRAPAALGVGKDLTRALSAGIRKVEEGRYEVDRAMLNRVLQNTNKLATSAFIRPKVDKQGKPAGFGLYRIRPNSLYALLGLEDGDVVNAVNGRAMLTPEVALTFFTKLRHMSHLTVSFDRRGRSVTHDYTIR